jgi:hypothetical protein
MVKVLETKPDGRVDQFGMIATFCKYNSFLYIDFLNKRGAF